MHWVAHYQIKKLTGYINFIGYMFKNILKFLYLVNQFTELSLTFTHCERSWQRSLQDSPLNPGRHSLQNIILIAMRTGIQEDVHKKS
jgi:hypothetical protein